jgi:DNA-binding PadR family transcriptional regulator
MKNVNRFIPLQEPTIYIMLSLRSGEKHGYAILKEVSELSDKRIKLSTGTLYGALYRLLDQGLIEQVESKDSTRGKKSYRLTRSGLEVFDLEVGRMKHLLLAVNKKLETTGGQQV